MDRCLYYGIQPNTPKALSMRLDTGQHMRLEQRMKLSPRMIQSMEILQLATLALEERIEQELEANPLLEMRESLAAAKPDQPEKAKVAEEERPMQVGDNDPSNGSKDFERATELSDQYDSYSQNTTESAEFRPASKRMDGERDSKMDAMANTACRAPSLTEQLLDQWRYVDTTPEIKKAGEHLAEFVDDDGYIRTEMETIVNQAPPAVNQEQLELAHQLIRTHLEPTGIGATDLPDCLLLQIDALIAEQGPTDELTTARVLAQHHLKDIEMNRLPKIARAANLTIDQVNLGLKQLRRLDPRPGRRLAPPQHQAIFPDVIIEYDPSQDRYVAATARGRQLALRINPEYRKLSKDRQQDTETRQYLSRNMSNARWLIDAIQQRQSTLLRVVNVVIDAQRDFLDHGPEHLKPLPMIQVADQLGIHVGTVSRAVADKYIQTPRGIFPLRQFFSGGTESQDGKEMSWSAVQAKLKQIVDDEDPASPYSDDQLVEKLKEKGIEIARRTVAKYRAQLNIPPARRRRKFN